MRSLWVFSTLVACAYAASFYNDSALFEEKKVRYDNYKVYQIKVQNITQLSFLDPLRAEYQEYDIWKDYDDITKVVNIMVAPSKIIYFQQYLKSYGLENTLQIDNVQDLIDIQNNRQSLRWGRSKYDWTVYHKLNEIEKWMDGILKSFPEVTEDFVIGKSYEKRKIRGIKIAYKPNNPGIFIEATIHAREWIAAATATWFIDALLTSKDTNIRNLAENYNWYIVPVLNVDGYVYSHKKDRLWRKTRQPNKSTKCKGVDPNRNFDFQWGSNVGKPGSDDPCSPIFVGPKPFSEPETIALANYLTSIKDKIKIYLALHSFGQFIFSPYSFSRTEAPRNKEDLKTISTAFVDAIFDLPDKTRYAAGTSAVLLYATGGTTSDWAFAKLGVKISYTIEFRDLGVHGFDLPPDKMLANYQEFMAGTIALVNKAK